MKTKKATNKKSTKTARITKKSKKNKDGEDVRKIPEDKLKEALRIIKNPEDPFWIDRNRNCTTGIHQGAECESIKSNLEYFKIKQTRICLMRRDWINLAKVLGIFNPSGSRSNSFVYPLCVKYAMLCLAHHDKVLLERYLHSVGIIDSTDEVIKQCASFPEDSTRK